MAVSGLLVIDKPLHMTSRDAVNRAWRWLPRGTRIGHTGTLDPLASGVLVVCAGVATRLAEYVQRLEKVYRTGICLGVRSSTDDGEGTLTATTQVQAPSLEHLSDVLRAFRGTIDQVPPDHSAAKVTGRRAYALARQGREVALAPRPVTIHDISVLDYAYPRLDLEVRCGKGTYIRALARDLGERLGCGAYLQSLRRTRVGPFNADDSLSLDEDRETALARLRPLADAVSELPRLVVADTFLERLHTGQGVPIPQGSESNDEIAFVSSTGALQAIGQVDRQRGLILPTKVFVSGGIR